MIKYRVYLALLFLITACSNSPEFETGEIKTFQIVKNALMQKNNPKQFPDSRKLLSRKQIDSTNIPILFVELASGQNGTLTPYPGQGIGQTWLAADGATVTLDQGVIKASRGMGNDIMGGYSSMPSWVSLGERTQYVKVLNYLSGNNKLHSRVLDCQIKKTKRKELIEVWGIVFEVKKYQEACSDGEGKIHNTYYVDQNQIVRRSFQYHSSSLGYLTIERLERLER